MISITETDFLKLYRYGEREQLGRGGFGTVFRVWDNQLHAYVALKLGDMRMREGKRQTVLESEVEVAQSLPTHPNIAVYESYFRVAGEMGEREFARMRYYPDGNLHAAMQGEELTSKVRGKLVQALADGLSHLHSHGVLHRDLKPSNVLMARAPDGSYAPLIADFGLGKIAGSEASRFSQSFAGGSTLYAAPEQLMGERVGYMADVWSWGVISYELLIGRHPYGADARLELDSEVTVVRAVTLAKAFDASTDIALSESSEVYKKFPKYTVAIKEAMKHNPSSRSAYFLNSTESKFSTRSPQSAQTKTIGRPEQLTAQSQVNNATTVDYKPAEESNDENNFSLYILLLPLTLYWACRYIFNEYFYYNFFSVSDVASWSEFKMDLVRYIFRLIPCLMLLSGVFVFEKSNILSTGKGLMRYANTKILILLELLYHILVLVALPLAYYGYSSLSFYLSSYDDESIIWMAICTAVAMVVAILASRQSKLFSLIFASHEKMSFTYIGIVILSLLFMLFNHI